MKKALVAALSFVIFSSALLGCLPTLPTAPTVPTVTSLPTAQPVSIPLELDDQNLALEFQQNGVSLPLAKAQPRWQVKLRPEPFALLVNGEKALVSILALKSAELNLLQEQPTRPVVTIPGTGNRFSQNDLYLLEQPIETYTVNLNNLQHLSYFLFTPEQATHTVQTLKEQLGAEPLVLFSPRSYLNLQPGQEQNYQIQTLNGNAPQPGQTIVLLIFIEKQSNDPFFKVLKWVEVELLFE